MQLKRQIRNIRTLLKKFGTFYASRIIVTPYAGFVLSTHYLSEDIDTYGLHYLNKHSKSLKSSKIDTGEQLKVIFCQTNQIDEFVRNHLDKIRSKFVLITGRDHWSRLEIAAESKSVLSNPNLQSWFSQNQIYPGSKIRPFPYGVNLQRAMHLILRNSISLPRRRKTNLFYPHCTIHGKNDDVWQSDILSAMEARARIRYRMEKPKSFPHYVNDLLSHKYVVSPAGDRPDTYRHWEILYLGGIPVSNVPESFLELFGSSMIIVDDLEDVNPRILEGGKGNPGLAKVKFWREVVKNSVTTFR